MPQHFGTNKEQSKNKVQLFNQFNIMKPKAPIPPKPKMSEEERKEQMTRAFLQKRASLAEGILFNLCQAKDINNNTTNYECKLMVDVAIEMADHLMEKLYGAKTQE